MYSGDLYSLIRRFCVAASSTLCTSQTLTPPPRSSLRKCRLGHVVGKWTQAADPPAVRGDDPPPFMDPAIMHISFMHTSLIAASSMDPSLVHCITIFELRFIKADQMGCHPNDIELLLPFQGRCRSHDTLITSTHVRWVGCRALNRRLCLGDRARNLGG